MAKTLAELVAGEDMEGGEAFCDTVYNNLKNHWRAAAAPGTPSPGMLFSDEDDEKLYHRWAASWGEVVQGNVPLTDELAVIVGTNSDGSFYYDEAVNDEVVIEARNAAATEGITISLLETNQRFRLRQNSDIMSWYLDGTDAFMMWSDGQLEFQTDEIDAQTVLRIRPNGTSEASELHLYDADGLRLALFTTADRGFLRSVGGTLGINNDGNQGVTFFESAGVGENPDVYIYGYITAGAAVRYGRFRMDDTNDEFEIEAENNANIEGITALLLETNQAFRVRGAARAAGLDVIPNDAQGCLLNLYSGVYYSAIQESNAEGLAGADLRIGLDETLRTMIILDRGDINADLALIAQMEPSLYIFSASASVYQRLYYGGVYSKASDYIIDARTVYCRLHTDLVSGDAFNFVSSAGIELVDTNAEQAWIYAEPKVRQTLTAAFDGLYLNATLTSLGDGTTGDGNNLLRLAVSGTSMYRIDTDGIIHNKRVGDLMTWTYQGDVADDGTFNLPAITDACWGFIQAGANEEYALFTIDDDGDVTLISNSANVVANADIDGNLVLGTAATQEPLTIRNRLGGVRNINLIIWYS